MAVPPDSSSENANWDDRFGGMGAGPDGPVYAVAIDGDEVFIAGKFSSVGGVGASRVARWDGSRWRSLGTGLESVVDGIVLALAVIGDTVYVGGQFEHVGWMTANNIAVWNRTTGVWSPLLYGVSGGNYSYVASLLVHGRDLYICGRFSSAGTTIANNVARYDGRRCYRFGAGVLGDVFAMGISGNYLYVGGSFESAGNVPAANVARWDLTTSTWSALPGGGVGVSARDTVYAIAVAGDDVYLGGSFSQAGGLAVGNVVCWNESSGQWRPVAGGVNGRIATMLVADGNLYVGGKFDVQLRIGGIPGLTARSLIRYDKQSDTWVAVGSVREDPVTTSPIVYALTRQGSELLVVGSSVSPIDVPVFHLAKLDIDRQLWIPVSAGVAGPARALARGGGDLFVGGDFDAAGGHLARRIARWRQGHWSALGSGFDDGSVDAIAMSNGMIYAGGSMTASGGDSVSGIAAWDGERWRKLGGGLVYAGDTGAVRAIAVVGDEIYAAGSFVRAGSERINGIARWDGSRWQPLGAGLACKDDSGNLSPADIRSLVVVGDLLYVAGRFNASGDLPLSNLAVWNMKTGTWSAPPMGGTPNVVTSMAFDNGRLYLAENVTPTGPGAVAGIELVDLATGEWTRMTSNIAGVVNSIDVVSDALFIGGLFESVDSVVVHNVARWDGEAWHSLGSGTNAAIDVLAADSGGVFCGGRFTLAGARSSVGIARWNVSARASVSGRGDVAVAAGALASIAPNPIRTGALFSVQLQVASELSIELYSADGRRVAPVAQGHFEAGRHAIAWQRQDLPEGMYLCRLRLGSHVETRTVVVGP